MDAPVIPPTGGLARHDRTPEVLATLRQIRNLLVLLCLLTLGMALVATDTPAPAAPAAPKPTGNAIPVAARRIQLQITGDPYAEAIGHIGYLDGSEGEYAPGVYSVTGLAGARIDLTADSGFSTCRITVDGEMVSEQTATNQQTVTCHWESE